MAAVDLSVHQFPLKGVFKRPHLFL